MLHTVLRNLRNAVILIIVSFFSFLFFSFAEGDASSVVIRGSVTTASDSQLYCPWLNVSAQMHRVVMWITKVIKFFWVTSGPSASEKANWAEIKLSLYLSGPEYFVLIVKLPGHKLLCACMLCLHSAAPLDLLSCTFFYSNDSEYVTIAKCCSTAVGH